MTTETIIKQQAFRRNTCTGKGRRIQRHLVALVIKDEHGAFRVDAFEGPLGIDGLPDFAQSKRVEIGERVATLTQADCDFHVWARKQHMDCTPVANEDTLTFTDRRKHSTGEPAYSYTFDTDTLAQAREHLARTLDNALVSSFLDSLSKQDSSVHWPLSARTSSMPILVSLALAGIGTLYRDFEALSAGQLRSMGMFAGADFWMEPLYLSLNLRSGRVDFGKSIGAGVCALVL